MRLLTLRDAELISHCGRPRFQDRDDARVVEAKPEVVREGDLVFEDADILASFSADATAYATANTPEANPYPWWTWVNKES
jgi:hypothetical protein